VACVTWKPPPTGELLSWLKSQQIRFAKGNQKGEVQHGQV
jgi:hypothetical protein